MHQNTANELKNKAKKKKEVFLQKAYELISNGVLVHDVERLDIRGTLTCGKDVEIDLNVIIEGNVVLGDGVFIGANCILKNCDIGNGTQINPFSFIESSIIGKESFIGPYGRIRPGTIVSDKVQIGNFVEIKNAKIGSKCRINHLSFIGDAHLEDEVTIGAGTITCNHDGVDIQSTTIGKRAYIGSGCNLVAPLNINHESVIGAGSTITSETPSNLLTLARSKQFVVKNWKGSK
jgi:bifunctional UDP-N-acetylglucosamine pyrophosphorylase/glucosamine-1-phosphate N-acetyltransferase